MRSITILLLLFSHLLNLHGQHLAQGSVLDENQSWLVGATVVLLEPIDSTMVSFAISDSDGEFSLEDVEAGDYVLQISFVAYKTMMTSVTVAGNKKVDLGAFEMEPMLEVLQEVTVKAEHIPMGVIGDTISYNAAAFKTKPGATVEDLLKKLPGVEVSRDGSIKAMGEEVENVLVDGKEFFGNDPKIATKNLEAEAVDKVQVFDKKSEIAEFTGIDDGEEEKTINLKLKEEYKKGGFGNASLAGGDKSTYDGRLTYNRFSPKMQAAVILNANNINKQAFSFNDYIGFMGGLGNAINNINSEIGFSEFGGAAPEGITDNLSSGVNFSYDLSSKLKLNSHYFYIDTDRDLDRNIMSSQFSNDLMFETIDQTATNRANRNHRLNASIEYKINPFTEVKWKNTISSISNRTSRVGSTAFFREGMRTVNTSTDVLGNSLQQGVEGNVSLRKKFQKKGRNWINTARYQYGDLNEDQSVQNQILSTNSLLDVIQNQDYGYRRRGFSLESAYTEALSKKIFLTGKYAYKYDREEPERLFFDVINEDEILNQSLSRSFVKRNIVHSGSLGVRRNTKKLKTTASVAVQSSLIDGEVQDESRMPIMDLRNKSVHVLPQMSIDLDVAKNSKIELDYYTSVELPTLQQLAPLPDNTNPNILVLGNPELIPTYTHDLVLHYRSTDQFNFKYFFAHLNFTRAQNQVINSITLDSNLIRTFRPENSDRFTNLNSFVSYSAPLRPLKLKFTVTSTVNWSGYDSFINNSLNQVNETNTTLNFRVDNRNKELVDVSTGIDLSFTDRKYDINDSFNQSFINYSLFIDGAVYLGDTWVVTSKYDYKKFSGEIFADAESFHLLHASIQKSWQENKIALSLSINDAFNQTRGVRRYGDLNGLHDLRFNTRARYVMLGLKVRLGRKKKDGISL